MIVCISVALLLRRVLYKEEDRTIDDYRVMFFTSVVFFCIYLLIIGESLSDRFIW